MSFEKTLAGLTDCEAAAVTALRIAALGDHLDDKGLRQLQDCLGVAPVTAQSALARACVLAAPEDRLPTLTHELLHDKRDTVRDAAAEALAELGPLAFPAIRRLLQDDDRDVRWFATTAVARVRREDSIGLLVDQLFDDDFAIRWVASNGLLDIGSPTVIPVVQALAEREPSPLFHNAARRVLSRVSASDVLRELVDALVDSLSRPTTIYESQGKALDVLRRLRADERA